MQWVICLLITLLIGSPAGAGECKSELFGLTAHFYSRGDQWSKTWKVDGVHKEKSDFYANLKEDSRTNVHDSRYNRSSSLPQTLLVNTKDKQQTADECETNPGQEFNIPFDISQNRELLVTALYSKKSSTRLGPSHPSQQFAIVDLKKLKILRIIDSEYRVEALAWAPDGKKFAVLYSQEVTKQVFKGPIDWFAEQLGHGNYYWTFYLTIYQADGTSVCTSQIEKKLINAMSFIDWDK